MRIAPRPTRNQERVSRLLHALVKLDLNLFTTA